MNEAEYSLLMSRAAKRAKEMDAIDKKTGRPTPYEIGIRELLATASVALEAGIRLSNWDLAADAKLLLEDAVRQHRLSRVVRGQ